MKHRYLALVLSVIALVMPGVLARAQEQSAAQTAQPTQLLTPQQLNNLVAPIALYPDPLLGQILVASTYPLEVVEANQWLQRNKNLKGEQLMDAAKQKAWDPSIQALVAVPDALAKLNQDISWTTDLGNAFLAQESDVMNAVQQMRAKAQANGNLKSSPQQTVTTQAQGGQQVVVIEPADPQVIYVPWYDPYYIWGPPLYGYYPPLYYPAYGFGFGFGFNLGFYFGGWGGWGAWGWAPYWYGHTVYINNYFCQHYGFHHGYVGGYGGRTVWTHDPVHRLGVPYRSQQVAARYGGPSMASRSSVQAGAGSRVAVVPFESRSGGRTVEQGYRNTTPQSQRSQVQPQQTYQVPRYQVPQQRSQETVQRYQAPQQRSENTVQRYQAPQQRSETPQQRYQAPVQRDQSPVQRNQAPVQRYQAPVQRYQAPVQSYQAPVQRYQAPAQRFQAPQQFRSAPQMSAPRFSGGGSIGGGRVLSGGGSSRSSSGGGGGRRR